MFIGREQERNTLEVLYEKKGFQMPVIYGRRRIGKTRLIREFCAGKRVIFYTATQDEENRCLKDFTACIKETEPDNGLLQSIESFPDWSAALDYITGMAKERLILVIDEYPYLAKSYPAISSVLQKYIDSKWKGTELFLILSGSSMSFMENQVLGYESPLYGRQTAQMKLKKMDYYDSIKYLIALEILEKRNPVEETSAKKTIFVISDKLFYFWYHFIPKCRFQIAMGLRDEAYEKKILPHMPEYFGSVFEEVCMQYILRRTANRSIPVIYDDHGKWWGNNPQKKRQEEIDLVAVSSERILTGECKWQAEKVGYAVFNTLVERSRLIRNNREISYYLFSKSGFDRKLTGAKEEMLTLVEVKDMIGSLEDEERIVIACGDV